MQYISIIPKNNTEHTNRALVMREMLKKEKRGVRARLFVWTSVMVVALVVAVYPFIPLFMYHTGFYNIEKQNNIERNPGGMADAEEQEQEQEQENPTTEDTAFVPQDKNMLKIPQIGVNMEIMGGGDAEYAWSRGAWLEPETSTPDRGSNTVISAHRFSYSSPHEKTLYLIDKLEVGDTFSVYWEGEEYRYRVSESKITSPYALHILEPSDKPMLTIYTCDPVFSTEKRLVVTAELI